MAYLIVGLGNPGEEYENTRHNTGRMMAAWFAEKTEAKKSAYKVAVPDTYMNNSGGAVKKLVPSVKAAEKLIVVHDDLDMPLGAIKVSWNRGPGGHNGVLSIQKALKTEAFTRIRVGISPSTPNGKLKKPAGAEAVEKFILGEFTKKEMEVLKKVSKKVTEAIEIILKEGTQRAMNVCN